MTEMFDLDAGLSLVGKTAKSMTRSREAYLLTNIAFAEGEQFSPNPEGINGFFRDSVAIPPGTQVFIPYYVGNCVVSGSVCGVVTVRISEILSWDRLKYEGVKLGNCLKDDVFSQLKYASRVSDQSSSFWSMTILREDGAVEHLCLIEVWHLDRGNIIHQAEGVRPRTIPTAEAWYWLVRWCEAEGLDLREWDCYA
mmetsp:Transcript_117740/g.375323  ORF Transcript_117740/g.375323 Transcript_117740/m.375323 type:complete len:196 (+) Transcript_117740:379-966(+)